MRILSLTCGNEPGPVCVVQDVGGIQAEGGHGPVHQLSVRVNLGVREKQEKQEKK